MSYFRPIRFFFKGDKKVAGRYIADARRFVEQLQNQLGDGVTSARRRKNLADGVYIDLVIAGDFVNATITVPQPGGPPKKPPDDFVVHARTSAMPGGIDAEYPQQILRPKKEDRPWKTMFKSLGIPAYDAFPGAKGTYGNTFPDGVKHAGNVDWANEDGERISWYGPSTRYFFDAFHQPRHQYGKFVFNAGRPLLDVEQYILEAPEEPAMVERYVMGAAINELGGQSWLYVMQADLPWVSTDMTPVPGATVFFGEAIPLAGIPLRLNRYRLTIDNEGPVPVRKVVAESRESLWSATVARACQPWVFDPACARGHTQVTPVDMTAFVSMATLADPPGTTDEWHTLTFDALGAPTHEVTSVSQAGTALATLARDYALDGTPIDLVASRADINDTEGCFVLSLAGTSWAMTWRQIIPGGNRYLRRWIVGADLREGVVLFLTQNVEVVGSITGVLQLELWRKGTRVATVQCSGPPQVATGLPSSPDSILANDVNAFKQLKPAPMAPSFVIYGQLAYFTTFYIGGAYIGACATFAVLSPPAAEIYGSFRARAAGGSTLPPFTMAADFYDGGFSGIQPDADAHYIWSSCVTHDGTTMFSTPSFRPDDASLYYVDGNTLPGLTGVGGTNARYHPIWMLGRPPGAPPAI